MDALADALEQYGCTLCQEMQRKKHLQYRFKYNDVPPFKIIAKCKAERDELWHVHPLNNYRTLLVRHVTSHTYAIETKTNDKIILFKNNERVLYAYPLSCTELLVLKLHDSYVMEVIDWQTGERVSNTVQEHHINAATIHVVSSRVVIYIAQHDIFSRSIITVCDLSTSTKIFVEDHRSISLICLTTSGVIVCIVPKCRYVCTYRISNNMLVQITAGHMGSKPPRVTCCVAIGDAEIAVGTTKGAIELWNIETLEITKIVAVQEWGIRNMAYIAEDTFMCGTFDNYIALVNTTTGGRERHGLLLDGPFFSCLGSDNFYVYDYNGEIHVYEMLGGRIVNEFGMKTMLFKTHTQQYNTDITISCH
jgi:hypothetical protein